MQEETILDAGDGFFCLSLDGGYRSELKPLKLHKAIYLWYVPFTTYIDYSKFLQGRNNLKLKLKCKLLWYKNA